MFLKALIMFSGLCFAYGAVPTAWKVFKAKANVGIPIMTIWMILLGVGSLYAYLVLSYGFDLFLFINHTVEFMSWLVVLWFHYKPKVVN